jgi:hypothetical protein
MTTSTSSMTSSPVQAAAAAVGAVFLLVGVAGFVPGLTQNLDDLRFAGHDSDAQLLGLFQVSVLHNLVHVLFGVAGLMMARSWSGARTFLLYGGAVYLVLFVYGMLIDHDSSANFVGLNAADDYLHLVLGVAMVAVGGVLGRQVTTGRE